MRRPPVPIPPVLPSASVSRGTSNTAKLTIRVEDPITARLLCKPPSRPIFHCIDSLLSTAYQLITVIIAAAGGGLLLVLTITLVVTCCRKSKSDISKLIFKSGDFQMSPYAEYPKTPRSSEWGRETIEMQENGSTKNLLQMTDIYYSVSTWGGEPRGGRASERRPFPVPCPYIQPHASCRICDRGHTAPPCAYDTKHSLYTGAYNDKYYSTERPLSSPKYCPILCYITEAQLKVM
ncbi:unnamed protein product [Ranitomeya imitator]|uniref:Uncharacterized protein n=1 Tax=Ranitomeya imitator TaxID=111125 RepID=A0ABN9MG48_9NEOB|nr:unnamed protein product [Ranitomeya imitator]